MVEEYREPTQVVFCKKSASDENYFFGDYRGDGLAAHDGPGACTGGPRVNDGGRERKFAS